MKYSPLKKLTEDFIKLKGKVTENEDSFDERDFYYLINSIKEGIDYFFTIAEKNPDYNYLPTPKVPASLEMADLEQLKEDVEEFIQQKGNSDDNILNMMFPNRHDDDFDEDDMNFDSVFGK